MGDGGPEPEPLAGEVEALRGLVAQLRAENARLLHLIGMTGADRRPADPTQTGLFDRAPGQVDARSTAQAKVEFFATLFRARRDVYAVRWENARTGRGGWMPAVAGGWRKGMSAGERAYLPLTAEVITAHLAGETAIGLYPLRDGDRCCWVAADFDGSTAMLDALAYLKAARAIGVPTALEVSRSGAGAHVWVFFTDAVPAALARQLATGLIREAIAMRGRMDLASYDRLFPSQDVLAGPAGLGNLIAAPLQGRCRRDGTTVFLDLASLEPYEDQWAFLSSLDRMTPHQVDQAARRVRAPVVGPSAKRLVTSSATRTLPPAATVVRVSIGSRIVVEGADLSPGLCATLKHAASLANPAFHERQRQRLSTWNTPRFLQGYDETVEGNLLLPRGLMEVLDGLVAEAGSRLEVTDTRAAGNPVALRFTGELRDDQQAAVTAFAGRDLGLIVAPPGAGKTVIACAIIGARAVSTLILVDHKSLADQWRMRIADLLGVKPGQLGGGRKRTRGEIDIITLQTLARREDVSDLTSGYGLVVVDECHHVPAAAFDMAVRQIPARSWLGLTATPYRRDQLDELIWWQLGPVRHEIVPAEAGTLDEAREVPRPTPVLRVHPTSFRYGGDADPSAPGGIAAIYRDLVSDTTRVVQVVDDVVEALARDRNCLVLTQWKSHVEVLAAEMRCRGHDPTILVGGMGAKARAAALDRLAPREAGPPLLVIATGPYVGEGFDCPALDTLFLAAPITFKGRLVQYVGRVLRPHPGKATAEVHDYHDVETGVLASSLAKRAPGYTSLGFADPRRLRS
ncbi:MAG TPA: DEAD/DEAH box helicase family protein [Sporichthyaceae bacterium]|nr:DEAD/DEAH box helicase family protein [Sporichthyaceae bacterium]